MKTPKLRGKRLVVTAVATAAALAVGGVVWTSAAGADVSGGERDRVAGAAVQAVGGTAVDVESSDDGAEAYEVQVRKDDGSEVDVALDKDLKVLSQDADGDRVLNVTERASAEKAALDAVGGGTVTGVEAGDDGEAAYEVEVRHTDSTEWEVELDTSFAVLSKTADN